MRGPLVGLLFSAVFCGPALAQPQYPIDDWCKKLARIAGGGMNAVAICRSDEKKAQQKVRMMGYTPERIATWCDNVATQGTDSDGSYQVYLKCVQDEFTGRGSPTQ